MEQLIHTSFLSSNGCVSRYPVESTNLSLSDSQRKSFWKSVSFDLPLLGGLVWNCFPVCRGSTACLSFEAYEYLNKCTDRCSSYFFPNSSPIVTNCGMLNTPTDPADVAKSFGANSTDSPLSFFDILSVQHSGFEIAGSLCKCSVVQRRLGRGTLP